MEKSGKSGGRVRPDVLRDDVLGGWFRADETAKHENGKLWRGIRGQEDLPSFYPFGCH